MKKPKNLNPSSVILEGTVGSAVLRRCEDENIWVVPIKGEFMDQILKVSWLRGQTAEGIPDMSCAGERERWRMNAVGVHTCKFGSV